MARDPSGGPSREPHRNRPGWDDEDDLDASKGRPIDRLLRVLEAVICCCLMTMVLFWFADRLRSVNFEPILVSPCEGAACVSYEGPYSGSAWAVFTDMLEPSGVTTFSGVDMCVHLATHLQTRGVEATGVDLITDLMQSRGTLVVQETTAADAEVQIFSITAGARNDGFGDAVRDALVVGPSRGCHSLNYKPVFWPLFFAWTLLASLRALRSRQQIWAQR